MSDFESFMCEQEDSLKEQIRAINAAILFLINNPTKSYEFDSGQTKTKVDKNDLEDLRKLKKQLVAELREICPALPEIGRPAC